MLTYSSDDGGDLISAAQGTPSAPQIIGQPVDQLVSAGDFASFSVVVAVTSGVTFQWAFNGTVIAGATGDSLLLPVVAAANAGQYSVTVTNGAGTVTSSPATLALDTGSITAPPGLCLTAYSDPGGSVTVVPFQRDYGLGEPVTLTAAPSAPSVFVGWSGISTGDLLATTNPVTVTMTADTTVRARFAAPGPLPAGVVAFWRGEGDATDLIGGYSGTFTAGSTPTPPSIIRWGKVGSAFAFDGTTCVQIPDAPGLQPPQITLEAWVFPTVLSTSGQTVIGRGSSSSASDETWLLGVLDGIPQFVSHSSSVLAGPTAIALNAWTHLAATFDGATKVLYVNGTQVNSQGGLGALPYAAVPVGIGATWQDNAPAELFTGFIDEVSLYDRALTCDEVFDIYNADIAGKNVTAPYFTTSSPLLAVKGTGYTQQLTTVLGTAPVTFALSAGALPPGMTLSPAGAVSGVPGAPGVFDVTVTATDASGNATEQLYVLTVASPVPAPPGMVGWWKAEGNALDSAGTNNGVLQGGAGYAAGEVGQAFSLDGSTGCVQIPDAPALRPAALTLEAWVKFSSISGIQIVFAKPVGTGASDSYALWLNSGILKGQVSGATAAGPELLAPAALIAGTWYHVAYTADDSAGQQALYVNGIQVAIGAITAGPGYDTQPLFLGRDNEDGPTYFLQGLIDEATLYNRALAPAEIASIYNAGPAGKQPVAAPVVTGVSPASGLAAGAEP
jgi:hypothetical protein